MRANVACRRGWGWKPGDYSKDSFGIYRREKEERREVGGRRGVEGVRMRLKERKIREKKREQEKKFH